MSVCGIPSGIPGMDDFNSCKYYIFIGYVADKNQLYKVKKLHKESR